MENLNHQLSFQTNERSSAEQNEPKNEPKIKPTIQYKLSDKRREQLRKSGATYNINHRDKNLERYKKCYYFRKEVKRLYSIECY